MKLVLFVSCLLLSGLAQAATVLCEVKVNGSVSSQTQLDLQSGQKTSFGAVSDFDFYLINFNDKKFGIEVVDMNTPSRSYAEGYLQEASSELIWALWSREILLEVKCTPSM